MFRRHRIPPPSPMARMSPMTGSRSRLHLAMASCCFFSAARRPLRAAKWPSCACSISWASPARGEAVGRLVRASSVIISENLHFEFGPTPRLISLPGWIPSMTAQPSAGSAQMPEMIKSWTSTGLMVSRSSGVALRIGARTPRGPVGRGRRRGAAGCQEQEYDKRDQRAPQRHAQSHRRAVPTYGSIRGPGGKHPGLASAVRHAS